MPVERVKVADSSSAPKSGSHKAFHFAGEGDGAVQILLSNVGGSLHATSAKCTHYGAPLANGVLTGSGKLICPWHGACFDAKTGDIEEAPALDNLLALKVDIDRNGDVYVEADPEKLKGKPGIAPGCSAKLQEQQDRLVIVGGGSAAINAVESARKGGYSGPITIVTSESHAPVDRTKLSKGLIASSDSVTWRSPSHLRSVLQVELKQDTQVTGLDLSSKRVLLGSAGSLPYDALILATGGQPKRLPVPGAKEGELQNIFVLRGISDTSAIVSACGEKQDKDVVVIGTSFIGMETAIALAGQKKAKSVKVVGMEEVPFERVLGKEVGEGLMKAQQDKNGIQFYNKAGVQRFEGNDGKVKAVVIKDENGNELSIDAQIVVLGVGVAPATGFLKETKGFPELLKDGSVAVDDHLRVKGLDADANVFACGDIATVPARDPSKGMVRIEHWNVAGNHGRSVGALLAAKTSKPTPYNRLPIFWSALGGQLRYVSDGNPPGFDECYVDGEPGDLKFAAFYGQKGVVTAIASMGVDPLVSHSSELMRMGKMPSLDAIEKGTDPLSISLTGANM